MATNNAWNVLCVSDASPSDTPFLISRNVRVGRYLHGATPLEWNKEGPAGQWNWVAVATRGGGVYHWRGRRKATGEAIFGALGTNTIEAMRP